MCWSARTLRCLTAAIALTALAACTGGGPLPGPTTATAPVITSVPSPDGPVATSVLRCDEAIGTGAPQPLFRIVLGVVALPASPAYPALQTSTTGDESPGLRLFAKTGLVIRSGVSFDLVVPTQPAGRVGIGWGSPATPSVRFTVPKCPGQGGQGWLAYPGGYWIDRPACASLIVEVAGAHQLVQVGLGRACPGQRPPQGLSQSS